TDRADRDRARLELEGEGLPASHEDDDGDQADDVVRRSQVEPSEAGDDACDRYEADEGGQRRREREEVWSPRRMRALLLSLPQLARARLGERAGSRRDVIPLLGNGREAGAAL